MYPVSGTMKDLDGKVLKVEELYNGRKVEVTSEELRKYDMHPQSGSMKLVGGEIVSLVDLILTLATSGGGDGSGSVHWNNILGKTSTFAPSEHEHNDKVNIIKGATEPQGYIGFWHKKEV